MVNKTFFVHSSSYVDESVQIGNNTKIWHFCHISKDVSIGNDCSFGQNVFIASNVNIGNKVKVQNNVSIYTGCEIEDEVFLGPSCVLTNVTNPRSQVNRHSLYESTIFRRGCTIGANATIVCGIEVGRYAFVGAGTVVTKSVPDYALIIGNPGRQKGWMSRHGHLLKNPDSEYVMTCPESGLRYKLEFEILRCIDLDEDLPLPQHLSIGGKTYDEFKQ
jgi:UDP-2-acetamido-3-amino-2,3-dideoxy-glucuronate N-acetyltransferase